jgi:tripartite ATP-independent transporter DctM subunit
MSISMISLILFISLLMLLLMGLPLAFTTGSIAAALTLFLYGPAALQIIPARIYDVTGHYVLVAVPLFIFMANMLERAGVAEQMYGAVHIWSGRLPGGLAIATIIACCLMGAMVGIIGAEVVTFGLIAVPTMLKRGYHKNLALGCVGAGGGLAVLIPPSIVFIVYAMAAGVSVGKLFLAGVFPGLLLGGLYAAYIIIRSLINPSLAPPPSEEELSMPLKEKFRHLKGLILPFFIAMGVLGSIYAGMATPTEAAGVGCVGATIACLVNGRLNWDTLKTALIQTLLASGMLYWIIFGALSLVAVYNLAGGVKFVKAVLMSLPLGPVGILITMQVILIFLGCVLDMLGILLLCIPLFAPIVVDMGYSSIWFGVIFCLCMQIAYISPPFAPSAFYLKGVVSDDISIFDIYRSTIPYVFLILISLVLMMLFPGIALWLPSKVG